MQELPEILRRNRTVILLFTVLVIVPSLLLGYVGFRAIRADDVQQQFQRRNRERKIALLLNAELKNWLFSSQPDGAASQALIRFKIDGDGILFPEFQLQVPGSARKIPIPWGPGREPIARPAGIPTAQEIEEAYYPRIQSFLRDFK